MFDNPRLKYFISLSIDKEFRLVALFNVGNSFVISNISGPDISKIQKGAGILRYEVSRHDFESSEDKKKMLKMVDNFISTVL